VAEPARLRPDDLAEHVGTTFTAPHAITVTADMVRRFADLTGADHWMHVDAERAAAGPLGRATVQGLLTLSLGARLQPHVLEVEAPEVVFHGMDRLRFPAPLFVGDRVRLEIDLLAVEDVDGGAVQARTRHRFHGAGEKPVCVAEQIVRYSGSR
jgi:acyl dehydratase